MTELGPGAIFAGHRIDAVAGRGGMGVVYRAQQLDLDRPVALKVIAPALAQDPGFRERFVRESRAAAAIDHPNVIPIYYAGDADGVLYIAMRYVDGPDLRALVRSRGLLPAARAAHIVAQVGFALDAAHARGIVHRDVKPENVLLGAGDHPYLTDFGLTKRLDSAGGAPTRATGWVGTLGYVSPEQIRGDPVDARSDVYALGCVLVYALTGQAPFRRDSEEAALWAHLREPPPVISELVPGLSTAFDEIVARALAKEPAQRYPSAGDLGRAVLAAAGLGDPTAPERSVATGAAGWDDRPTAAPGEGATLVTPAGRTVTATAPTPPADTPVAPVRQGGDRRPRTGVVLGVVAALVVAGGAALALALTGGGDGGASTSTTRATVPAQPAIRAIEVGGRPNGIAIAGGLAWVLRNPEDRMATIDMTTGKVAPYRPRVGPKPSAIAAGFGKVWVANPELGQLISIDARTHRQSGANIDLPQGRPATIAVDSRSIWVGMRLIGRPDMLIRIDPQQRTVDPSVQVMPNGIQDLTTGAGSVWVLERQKRRVMRIATGSGDRAEISVGLKPLGIAYGEGAVWVTNSDQNSVTRIDPATLATQQILVGAQPTDVAVGAGDVWVTNNLGNSVSRIDPKTSRPAGEPIPLPVNNPYAIATRDGVVWVTSPPDGSVVRIRPPAR